MRNWIRLIAVLLLLSSVLLLHHAVVRDVERTLPQAALATAAPPLTLDAFSQTELSAPIIPVLKMAGYTQGGMVTLYYTTRHAPELFGLTLRYGSFDSWQDGQIVIGSELATALFLTDDAVGRTLTLNGRDYTVCGVYASPNSLLARASQTTAQDVYLPLSSYPAQNIMVSEVIVGLQDALSAENLAPELEYQLGVNLFFRSAYHFDETRRLAQQSEDALLLLLAVLFTAISAAQALRRAMRREWIPFAAAMLCVTAGIVWVLFARFPLFLPRDFILRSGSILDYILENAQLANEKAALFLCAYSAKAKALLALLDVGCIALLLHLPFNRVKDTSSAAE